jgi:hypothetical protein
MQRQRQQEHDADLDQDDHQNGPNMDHDAHQFQVHKHQQFQAGQDAAHADYVIVPNGNHPNEPDHEDGQIDDDPINQHHDLYENLPIGCQPYQETVRKHGLHAMHVECRYCHALHFIGRFHLSAQ